MGCASERPSGALQIQSAQTVTSKTLLWTTTATCSVRKPHRHLVNSSTMWGPRYLGYNCVYNYADVHKRNANYVTGAAWASYWWRNRGEFTMPKPCRCFDIGDDNHGPGLEKGSRVNKNCGGTDNYAYGPMGDPGMGTKASSGWYDAICIPPAFSSLENP